MAIVAIRRSFLVPVTHRAAWDLLAQAERRPEWAPHIRAVWLRPAGPLGAWSSGVLDLRGFGRNVFVMSAWDPLNRWEWVGSQPGLRVYYDHHFASDGSDATRLEWVVRLSGPLAALVRPIFAAVYGRNVDRAIPRIRAWMATEAQRVESVTHTSTAATGPVLPTRGLDLDAADSSSRNSGQASVTEEQAPNPSPGFVDSRLG